jgi:hypothetical protein
VRDEPVWCQNRVDSETRSRVVENDDYAAFVRRVIAAQARRIARGDIEGLADLIALAELVGWSMHTAVSGLPECGYSWTEIADRIGITRQAAQQHWGSPA